MNERRELLVFARWPEAGESKTRLIPALGAEGAANLQRSLTARTLMTARRAALRRSLSLRVCTAGGDRARFHTWLGADLGCEAQSQGDLGRRMAVAFQQAFQRGCGNVVLVGTDVPELTDAIIADAFESLAEHDVVLGPAADGGYYLIGLKRDLPELFAGVAWGTDQVLAQTLAQARERGLSARLVARLRDVDVPEDLEHWRVIGARERAGRERPTLSVVIPTLNEAMQVASTLSLVLAEPDVEAIVADGGSTDDTRALACACGARVVESEPGRGRQMNAGGAGACADTLLFLHAHTHVPAYYCLLIMEALAAPGVSAGAFRLRLHPRNLSLVLIEKATNLRARLFQMPYGDQGLFMRAATFREVGGYPEIPILEDVRMVQRVKRQGRIAIVSECAESSSRRWMQQGVWRTTMLHRAVMLAHVLGVSPASIDRRLARRRVGYTHQQKTRGGGQNPL